MRYSKMHPSPLTLRSLTLTTGLSPTPNRCISDFANASSKFLASLGTSDMPRTLGDIAKANKVRKKRIRGDMNGEIR